MDKTVSERDIVVSVQFSSLTKMFKVARRIDGAVTDYDVTDREAVMRDWMTRFDGLILFDDRDLTQSGLYYVRAKAKLLSKFRMLVIPSDLDTDWIESEKFRVVAPEE